MSDLRFRTIDLARDFPQCLQLRAVSYQASYGSLTGFADHYGDAYRARLAQKLAELPELNVHLWLADTLIGQIEASLKPDPELGYINLLVLKPEFQRLGYGAAMLQFLQTGFGQLGKTRMQLSVSPGNRPARAFYRKTGWQSLGPRPDKPTMLLMQKAIYEF